MSPLEIDAVLAVCLGEELAEARRWARRAASAPRCEAQASEGHRGERCGLPAEWRYQVRPGVEVSLCEECCRDAMMRSGADDENIWRECEDCGESVFWGADHCRGCGS